MPLQRYTTIFCKSPRYSSTLIFTFRNFCRQTASNVFETETITQKMQTPDAKTQTFLKAIEDNSRIITKVCYYYARDPDEFNDLRQDAMICLWQGWDKFKGESRLSTWIYRVCLNSCVSNFRSNRRHSESIPLEAMAEIAADTSDRTAMLSHMHSLISRLNPREKAVILLWLDNYPYDTILLLVR